MSAVAQVVLHVVALEGAEEHRLEGQLEVHAAVRVKGGGTKDRGFLKHGHCREETWVVHASLSRDASCVGFLTFGGAGT